MRYVTTIFAVCVAALCLVGCFKDEKQGTQMLIQLWSQNVAKDPILPTTSDVEGYAFEVKKGSKWEVSSWEDALNHRITNSENNAEQMTEPTLYANYDPAAEYQVSYDLWDGECFFLVIVDKTNKIYAARLYDTPMNLPVVYTQLHLYAHKKSGSANGWIFTNPFPDEQREPLVPTEEEEL